jgi:putative redox protein
MPMHIVENRWNDGMSFTSTIGDHKIVIDADEEFGGQEKGPRPKQLLLTSLCGCTGMDVVSILRKMKVDFSGFRVIAQAEPAEEHPKVYTSINLIYEFKGKDLPLEKLKKAVDLSQERYCPVSAMLRKACRLSYEIKISE